MNEAIGQIAHIALGANLGDREAALKSALSAIHSSGSASVEAVSSLYETAPVGGPGGQQQFLNAAAALRTRLEPVELLDLLQSIEAAHHRKRDIRWGPRTLDLDILFFGSTIQQEARLILPHPSLHQRRFVLAPLAEIAPALIHPGLGVDIAALLAALDPADAEDVRRAPNSEGGAWWSAAPEGD